MSEPHFVLGIGELLWDMLPGGAQLGGAPANFAVMAGRLGDDAAILSRIGRDDLGRRAMDRLQPMPVDSGHIQVDPAHETGRVTIAISDGEPSYTIQDPVAWDFLDLSNDWVELVERANVVCFGSLAQRNQISRQTIQALAAQGSPDCIRIFDANLRAPYYTAEVLQESLELASVLKMNEGEVRPVLEMLGLPLEKIETDNLPSSARDSAVGAALSLPAAERLLTEFSSLELVAITKGGRGSLLVARGEWNDHPGFPVKVVDCIGAGDAFTAALAHYLLRGASLATLNEAGNRWGGWMASQAGAMPPLPDQVRDSIAESIERAN